MVEVTLKVHLLIYQGIFRVLLLYNLRTQSGFQKHGAARFQIVIISCFDSTFAFVVYNPGALFCLNRSVVAGINEGFNHVVKGVDIVIEQNNLIVLLFVSKNI